MVRLRPRTRILVRFPLNHALLEHARRAAGQHGRPDPRPRRRLLPRRAAMTARPVAPVIPSVGRGHRRLVPARSVRLPRYYHLGRRLLLVTELHSAAGRAITSSLASKFMPTILDELKNLHPSEILKILVALHCRPSLAWQSWQLQLDSIALYELSTRNDIESWIALLDILLLIKATTGVSEDYRSSLIEQLKSRIDDFLGISRRYARGRGL